MANLIQATRLRLGVTGAELAARLGVTPAAISQLERSEREGTIRLESLERALGAMGLNVGYSATDDRPLQRYGAEAVTDDINAALDSGREDLALRLLTRAVQAVTTRRNEFGTADAARVSVIKDRKWETLFGALYGQAIPEKDKPAWASPQRLSRPWFVSQFEPLRERAKVTTPLELRRLNIFIDERSLSRA
ncbi:helix-turn-helix domain-containing protein [Leifsonia sp. fls2-241-R2A-40a]|uniref:helix-turn-helix domain-containing protein n=1 Tax=Leifsonia sp. fls2-241-R2A-40a TaxID=3040290 RepID=UPI00254F0304|nr:helix-turn-helix domain-containing protein [Leifsonia sp. fls2-241-R2A-40a]